jgi:hypothetical protein
MRRGNHLLHLQPEMREAGELLRAMNEVGPSRSDGSELGQKIWVIRRAP